MKWLKPALEEVGDFESRAWGLQGSAAAFSIHLDYKDSWPLPDLEGGDQMPCLWRSLPHRKKGAM